MYRENDIALNHVRNLFSHLFEFDCVASFHAPLHIDTKQLLLVHESPTAAVRALFRECFPFTLALGTLLLHFHLHHAHVNSLRCLASAFTLITNLHLSAFSACTLAFTAVNLAIDVEVRLSPDVQLLKRGLNSKLLSGAFLTSVLVSALFESLNLIDALLVVNLPFGLVGQHFIGSGHFGEFRCGVLVP